MDRSPEEDRVLLSRAAAWMRSRNWREKIAKSDSGQSLYEHSLIELDVFLQLSSILRSPRHYGLSELEENVVLVSLLVHDAGKETDEWQAYVHSSGLLPWTSHILPELSGLLVPQMCAALGLNDLSAAVHRVIVHCAGIHHNRPGQSDAAAIEAILYGAVDRFLTLANIVKAIDHVCSADSPSRAVFAAESDPGLQKHLKLAMHELVPRGVSTSLLHRAVQAAFEQGGWKPLLYFATGTVYVAELNATLFTPSSASIVSFLKGEIETALKKDVVSLMVGSPTGNILPKPDLLAWSETPQYLMRAGQTISPLSFAKKKFNDQRKVVEKYFKLKGRTETPSDEEVSRQGGRISAAQPEMMVFKFFKALMDPGKVPSVGEDGAALACQKYEAVFGAESWTQLQSTSTLMAAKDMAQTVDYYWALPGDAVGHPGVSVEELPNDIRLKALVDILANIAVSVFNDLKKQSPRDELAGTMASSFIADLIAPHRSEDIKQLAVSQLNNYRKSKPHAGKDVTSAVYLCPICNGPFDSGEGLKASADFIDNPQTHTNRGVSHGSFGYVMVCSSCYYERLLRKLLMGEPLAEIIAICPCLNLGPLNGALLTHGVRKWVDAVNGANGVEFGCSMNFTDQTARKVLAHDPFRLEPEELIGLFRYRFSMKILKERRREALALLKDEFEDLDALNLACGESFPTWESALDALVDDKIEQQECKAIRNQAFRLGDTFELIPQTPNQVLIPLRYEIASSKDESEAAKALRRLYVTLVLSVVFDASVSIRRVAEVTNSRHSVGAAFVPPVPSVRSLIRTEWIDVSEARFWLSAIGAASVLAHDAALPARSALYQALSMDPAEKLVRRLEETGRPISPLQLNLISMLPNFHAGQSKEVNP